jgi:hypothetical protein
MLRVFCGFAALVTEAVIVVAFQGLSWIAGITELAAENMPKIEGADDISTSPNQTYLNCEIQR